MLQRLVCFFALMLLVKSGQTQDYNHLADSVKTLLEQTAGKKGYTHDTLRISRLNKITKFYLYAYNIPEAITYCRQSIALSQKIKFKKGYAAAINNYGSTFIYIGNTDSAIFFLEKGAKLFTDLKDYNGVSKSYNNIGVLYDRTGKYDLSIKYAKMSLEYKIKNKDSVGIMASYMNLGVAYDNLGQNVQAIDYYLKALTFAEMKKEFATVGDLYLNIVVILKRMKKYDKCISYLNKAEAIFKKYNLVAQLTNCYNNYSTVLLDMGDTLKAEKLVTRAYAIADSLSLKKETGVSLSNLGNIYYFKKDFQKAFECYSKARDISKEISHAYNLATINDHLADIYMQRNDYRKAEELLFESYKIAEESGSLERKVYACRQLYILYAKQGKYKQALTFLEKHIENQKLFENEQNLKEVLSKEIEYGYTKKRLEDSLKNKHETEAKLKIQSVRHEAEQGRQRMFLYVGLGGLLIVIVISLVLYKGNKQKARANKIISEQKKEVENKNAIIEEKNKDITDSIKYAEKIQRALLQPADHINEKYPEHFILFQPRDIVSGDFYWSYLRNDKLYIAAADCTGHGVPGAMMSMMGMGTLNDIMAHQENPTPADILNELRKQIITNLGQSGKMGENKDGMDISLFCYDLNDITLKGHTQLQWAGANNPLWLFSKKEETVFKEFTPDKQPVGYHTDMKPFTNHSIDIYKGDVLYVFTDGYADQFGGPQGKKYKYKQLQKTLNSIFTQTSVQQKTILESTFSAWKAGFEQIDDVCIIGLTV